MNRERKYVQDIGFISETGAKSRGMREGEFEKIGQTCVKKQREVSPNLKEA